MSKLVTIATALELAEQELKASQERWFHELSTDYPSVHLLDQTKQKLESDKRYVKRLGMLLESERRVRAKRRKKKNPTK